MFIDQDRGRLRRFYLQAWEKARGRQPLEPLERLIVAVIRLHPEYHALLESAPDDAVAKDYLPGPAAENPFLHLGLHVAVHEQLAAGRPVGVERIYRDLAAKLSDAHAAEHRMMECLAATLWHAQRGGDAPSEDDYLACLRRLL